MRNFELIASGLDVAPMLAELDAQPELWNQNRDRKERPGTAHSEMDDIWLRARARDDIKSELAFNEPHWPVFYPAWNSLPSIHTAVWALMGMAKAVQLGGCLITRIPSGGKILPHADKGWHAEWFQTKYYIVLRGGPRCLNICENDVINMRPGEIFSFNNLVTHSVDNQDESDRISLIVTVRVEV